MPPTFEERFLEQAFAFALSFPLPSDRCFREPFPMQSSTQRGTSRKRARESLGTAAGVRDAKMARRAIPVRRQSDAHAQAAPAGGGGVPARTARTLTRPLRPVGRERSDSPHRAPSLAETGVVAQRLFRTPTPPTQRSKHPAVMASTTWSAAGNVQRPRPSGLEDSDSSWYFAWRRREEQKYVAGVMVVVFVVLLLLTAWGFSCAAPAAPVPRVLQWWCWPRGRSAVRMRPRRELCIHALSGTVAAPMRMHDPLTPQSTVGGAWMRGRTAAGQLYGLLLWVSGCGRAMCLRVGGGACCVRVAGLVCMGGCACALCVCQSVWKRAGAEQRLGVSRCCRAFRRCLCSTSSPAARCRCEENSARSGTRSLHPKLNASAATAGQNGERSSAERSL